ncbi:hypothetical protein NQ317_002163 [Molorchus minor]|uniref:Uncharacterized protein n=1 Tax=Molorchus minor TaxID=1323400 RepID=A0ABQ9ISK6_9CUCU|nr:hypothetical protein NQ317_002163 [Molorchus minor]
MTKITVLKTQITKPPNSFEIIIGLVAERLKRQCSNPSIVQRPMINNNLVMEGFIVTRWINRWNEGIQQNLKWIKEGKLKYKETITEGFENMFDAFTDMLKGGNIGKAIVKV